MERSNKQSENSTPYFKKQNTMTYKMCFKHTPISEVFDAEKKIDGCQRDKPKGRSPRGRNLRND